MKHHKIKSIEDITELQKYYENDAIFEVIETHEEINLIDLAFCYDGQEITIQHI